MAKAKDTTTTTAPVVTDTEAEIARLREENARLKAAGTRSFELAVSAKGAVSLYGVGRFPASYYREQWEFILDHAQEIRDFIAAHSKQLKKKGE